MDLFSFYWFRQGTIRLANLALTPLYSDVLKFVQQSPYFGCGSRLRFAVKGDFGSISK